MLYLLVANKSDKESDLSGEIYKINGRIKDFGNLDSAIKFANKILKSYQWIKIKDQFGNERKYIINLSRKVTHTKDEFKKELGKLINRYSLENGSNTPDFILAEYLYNCLENFNKTSRTREKWYGKELKI